MDTFRKTIESLISFRRVPLKVVVITAFASYALQLGAIIQGQPLYIIAIFTLLPWIPVLFFESIWKIDHYSWIAVFGILTILQIGHVGEHLAQVGGLLFLEGTLACPPPVDNTANFERAVEAGLRTVDEPATGISSTWVVQPDKATGLPMVDQSGQEIVGPAACGVLGQLDLEIVHLVWELIGWIAILWLLTKYPKNKWLWAALVFASIHTVEHLYISWIFFITNEPIYDGLIQLWGTTVEGKIVTAHPVGFLEEHVSFYAAGGKNGIIGRGGLLDFMFFNGEATFFPTRPVLHLGYNLLVTIPFMVAFIIEVRRAYNAYLAQALPELSEAQLVATTHALEPVRFEMGEIIVRQGDPPDGFYIITKGEAEVYLEEEDGKERPLAKLESGQYFGEIGLMNRSNRVATVRAIGKVELLKLDRVTFGTLMQESEMSGQEVTKVMDYRLQEVSEVQAPKSPSGSEPPAT